MKFVRKLLVGLGCLALIGLASVPFVAPAMAAFACPSCYSFERIAENVWVERGVDGFDDLSILAEAQDRVVAAFRLDELLLPKLLICATEECDRRLGGRGARARAFGDSLVVLSPRGRDTMILSHELAHIAIHRHVGNWGLLTGELPAWRNEGTAVLVSGDERYFNFVDARCLVSPDENLTTSPSEWSRKMRPDTHLDLYGQAACAVFLEAGLPPYDLDAVLQGGR